VDADHAEVQGIAGEGEEGAPPEEERPVPVGVEAAAANDDAEVPAAAPNAAESRISPWSRNARSQLPQ
jgi:hypothetical protein